MNLDFSYINDKGQKISGSPAFNHHVYTECGGVQQYNDKVGEAYINSFVAQHSDTINKTIEANAKRNRLKVV